MTRTNIHIDDELVHEVMRRYELPTKKDAVNFALRRLVGVPLTQDFLLGLRGIGWDGDLAALRDDAPQAFGLSEGGVRPAAGRRS